MSTVLASPPAAQDQSNEALEALHGRIRDVDSHEMFPARLWASEFGDFITPMADFFIQNQPEHIPNSYSTQNVVDDRPITKEDLDSFWSAGCLAPGAYDMARRLEFMDVAGVSDSLMFGSLAVMATQFALGGGKRFERNMNGKMNFEPVAMGKAVLKAHNDWCIRTTRYSPRLRAVGILLTHSLDEAVNEAERLIGEGVRAISVPAGETIGGKAPSHPDNDRLWNLLAKNNVPLLLHIGAERAFLRDNMGWLNNPVFVPNSLLPTEIPVDPFSFATCSLAPQNYITNLILGAVFERVPDLRCGVMELGAFWAGPIVENMDMWAEFFARRLKGVLSMAPSEYFRRNIRVTPFTFEPVDTFMKKSPFLEDVLCFSSDYPHYEGGKSPIAGMFDRVRSVGPDVPEKFFVTNAEWVMPA